MAPVVTSGSSVGPAALLSWGLSICLLLLQLPRGNGQCTSELYRGCALPQWNISKEGFAAIERIESRYLAIIINKLIISSVPSGGFLLRLSEFVDTLTFTTFHDETLAIPANTPLKDVALEKAEKLSTIQAGVNRFFHEIRVSDCLLIRLPTAFANLTQLVSVTVRRCRLTRLSFDTLSTLRRLDVVNVNMNQIRELIPVQNRSSEVNIETLILSYNHLEQLNMGIFAAFKRLQFLDLQNNHLLQLVTLSPVSLPALRSLDLTSNNLTTISWAALSAPSLDTISLSKNQLSEIPEKVNKFANLTTLLLGGNFIRSLDLSALHGLGHLSMLILSQNRIVDVRSLASGVTFPQLYEFNLEDNRLQRINATGWQLPMLRSFNLERNNFTAVPVQLFSQLGALEQLYMAFNPLRCRGLDSIKARLQTSVYVEESLGNGCTVGSAVAVNPQLTACCVQ